jgi:hypothetical protein
MQPQDIHSGLTADILRMLTLYDPVTGLFVWREDGTGHGSCARNAGDPAGWRDPRTGYVRLELPGYDGWTFLAHRLAYLWMKGEWPPDRVDHKNEVKSDNRWDNLRASDPSRNQTARGIRPHNTSGITGVSFHKSVGKWYAECSIDGQRLLHKYFKTKEEAVAAREAAVAKYHGEHSPPK